MVPNKDCATIPFLCPLGLAQKMGLGFRDLEFRVLLFFVKNFLKRNKFNYFLFIQ
jgi:hypothetical protein